MRLTRRFVTLQLCAACAALMCRHSRGAEDGTLQSWFQECRQAFETAMAWSQKYRLARSPSQLAECLAADAKFIRVDALREMWFLPAGLREQFADAERAHDSQARAEAQRRITDWTKSNEDSLVACANCFASDDYLTRESAWISLRQVLPEALRKSYAKAINDPDGQSVSRSDFVAMVMKGTPCQITDEMRKLHEQIIGWAKDEHARTRNGKAQVRFAWKLEPVKRGLRVEYVSRLERCDDAYDEEIAFQSVKITAGHLASNTGVPCFAVRVSYLLAPFDPDTLRDEPDLQRVVTDNTLRTQNAALIETAMHWLAANFRYCYFHPEEKLIKVDHEARARGISSGEYRKTHPWAKDDGPNKTVPKKMPPAWGE